MIENIIHTQNGLLHADTPLTKVDDLVSRAVDHGNIVLHFHGGLVSEAKGRQIAEFLAPKYDVAGAFPIFFVWEAGLLETVRNNLEEISKERLFRLILKRVVKVVTRKAAQTQGERATGALPAVDTSAREAELDAALDAMARGDDVAPPSPPPPPVSPLTQMEEVQLETELSTDFLLRQEVEAVSNGLRTPDEIAADMASRSATTVKGSATTLMDPESLDNLVDRPAPGDRGVISTARVVKAIIAVAKRAIGRFLDGRGHGLHATLVEEVLREFYLANVGGLIWKLMKKDTEDSFGDAADCGGTAVLRRLSDKMGDGDGVKITLVGHSTGAVYIAHLMKKAAEIRPQGFDFNLVFLAPAVTFDLIHQAISNHAEQCAGIRIFTMTDANERNDVLVPVLYPHSLLYFVSGVVEFEPDAPILGMARYFDKSAFPDADFLTVGAMRTYLDQDDDRVIWSITRGAPAGRNAAAVKHGDFDNEDETIASVQHIIANGF